MPDIVIELTERVKKDYARSGFGDEAIPYCQGVNQTGIG